MRSEPTKFNEWSLPLKVIVKQKNFKYGQDYKKEEKIDVYVSQNTIYPGPGGKQDEQIHSVMRFNVKSKANYDKEHGSSEVYQFVFGQEYLDCINQAQLQERAEQEDDDDMDDA